MPYMWSVMQITLFDDEGGVQQDFKNVRSGFLTMLRDYGEKGCEVDFMMLTDPTKEQKNILDTFMFLVSLLNNLSILTENMTPDMVEKLLHEPDVICISSRNFKLAEALIQEIPKAMQFFEQLLKNMHGTTNIEKSTVTH